MLSIPDPRDLLTLVPRMLRLLDDVEALVARIEDTRRAADEVVARISENDAAAGAVVERAGLLLDRIEEPVTTLQPVLERLAETTDPSEVDALVTVIDQLPALAGIVGTMSNVSPDVHELLGTAKDINAMLAKVPFLKPEGD